jgi:hypothetical protein
MSARAVLERLFVDSDAGSRADHANDGELSFVANQERGKGS